jgi:hypothetical protein
MTSIPLILSEEHGMGILTTPGSFFQRKPHPPYGLPERGSQGSILDFREQK